MRPAPSSGSQFNASRSSTPAVDASNHDNRRNAAGGAKTLKTRAHPLGNTRSRPSPLGLMALTTWLIYCICPLLVFYLLKRSINSSERERRKLLPPGPPGVPLLGNLLDFPTTKNWLTWRRLAEEYGACDRALVSYFRATNPYA
jgi:hypothetical protein